MTTKPILGLPYPVCRVPRVGLLTTGDDAGDVAIEFEGEPSILKFHFPADQLLELIAALIKVEQERKDDKPDRAEPVRRLVRAGMAQLARKKREKPTKLE